MQEERQWCIFLTPSKEQQVWQTAAILILVIHMSSVQMVVMQVF